MGSDCLSRKASRVALDSRSARPATTKRMRQDHPVAFLTKRKPLCSIAQRDVTAGREVPLLG